MKVIFERFIAGLVAAVMLAGISYSAKADNINVIVFGDSLTSGYKLQQEEAFPAKLERKLQQVGFTNVDVENMSNAGDTSADGLARVDKLLVKRPDIVLVEFGSNDALRGIAPSIITGNVANIVSRLQKNNVWVVLVGVKAPPSMGSAYASQLENGYASIAKSAMIGLYPSALEGILGKQEMNLADGIHPSAKGVEVMVEGIYPLVDNLVRAKYEQMRYEQQYQQQQAPAPDMTQ